MDRYIRVCGNERKQVHGHMTEDQYDVFADGHVDSEVRVCVCVRARTHARKYARTQARTQQ